MTRLFWALTLALFSVVPAFAADPPPVKREFRAVWVATVANIDWPSKKGLTADEQKKELVAMFDRFQAMNFNAIVMQVRPMADALYDSKLEPWSEYLTGEQGKSPGYDPLAFAVAEAHKRGLELHAWFNPYRAAGPSSKSAAAANHLTKTRPDLAKEYGKHHWLNPTHPVVQKHSLAVMLDAVMRYDIDGVHMDDYFYPYPEKDAAGAEMPFPDDDTWALYQQAGGKLSRDDWRRDAVNTFVKQLYADVKAAKPWVKVGISPFGIWRPGNPEGIAGFDQYAKLYADARLWLRQGWVDYFTPQLYWPIKQEPQSYPKLLEWWVGQNAKHRHVWPGNAPYRVAGKGWPVQEVADQIELTRQLGAGGNVHFSAKPILRDPDGLGKMFAKVYAEPALVPASPWLTHRPIAPPRVTAQKVGGTTGYFVTTGQEGWLAVVRARHGCVWTTRILYTGDKPAPFTFDATPDQLVVTAVDRTGAESKPAETP